MTPHYPSLMPELALQAVADHLPGPFWIKDREGHILFANIAFARDLDFASPQSVIGRRDADFWPAPVATRFRDSDQRALAGEMLLFEEHLETPTGERWYETRKLPFHDADGNIVGTMGMARDITTERLHAGRDRVRRLVLEGLHRGAPLTELLTQVVRGIEQERPGVIASILLLDPDGRHIRSGAAPGLPDFYNQAVNGLEIGEGVGSCGTAMASGERVVVDDIQQHPYWAPYRELAAQAGLAACWSEPIRGSHNQILGSFALYSAKPEAPQPADLELIQDAAHIAAVAIERTRADEALRLAGSVFEASGEAIVVTGPDNRILAVNPAFTRLTGFHAAEVIGADPKVLGSGRNDPSLYATMWDALRTTGHWAGEVYNRRKNGEEYVEWLSISTVRDAAGEVMRRIAMFSDITRHKEAEEKIWVQANYDHLTGLPNRRLFQDRLEQEMRRAQREGTQLAVLFIDIDRFREINEAHGHEAGDVLLIEIGQRIGACMRDTDTLARFSGDKFMVLVPGVREPGAAERVAQSILGSLGEAFMVGRELAYVAGSIGIALYPEDATDAEELLRHVDQALNAAKASGSGGFQWYTSHMQEAARLRRQLVRDLRGALAAGQFEVHYQPIADVATGRIVKAEALLRWRHPEHGLVSPAVFIPLAEEIGVIVEIGDWVFRTVARQVRRWCGGARRLQVSVNKSPKQFVVGNSHETWIDYLREIDLPADCLVIEITEGLLLDARPEVADKLTQFRSAGVQIAIDDFGTGYSALSYLQKFDVDYLKIDKSFIQRLADSGSDRALADAMVAMAHKLGLKVIAEGVETEIQRDHLASFGCDYIQGWFYGKAMPAEDFGRLLDAQ